jgi:hypothetical protein
VGLRLGHQFTPAGITSYHASTEEAVIILVGHIYMNVHQHTVLITKTENLGNFWLKKKVMMAENLQTVGIIVYKFALRKCILRNKKIFFSVENTTLLQRSNTALLLLHHTRQDRGFPMSFCVPTTLPG